MKEFARLRRIDYNFVVVLGLDDVIFDVMFEVSEWNLCVGLYYFDVYDGFCCVSSRVGVDVVSSSYYAMSYVVFLIYFELLFMDLMKIVCKMFFECKDWELLRIK